MTAKSDLLIEELVAACIAFGRQVEPDWQTRIETARREIKAYIAELEAALTNARELIGMTPPPAFPEWIPVSERLPEEEGWYYAGVLGRFGDHYTHDVYFYAEDAAFRWKDCKGDKVYCWLDGVPELPEPPEAQQ